MASTLSAGGPEGGGDALDLDVVAAGEGGVDGLDALPDAGVELAGLVAQHHREEGLAVLAVVIVCAPPRRPT
jgi:hypothetical protein